MITKMLLQGVAAIAVVTLGATAWSWTAAAGPDAVPTAVQTTGYTATPLPVPGVATRSGRHDDARHRRDHDRDDHDRDDHDDDDDWAWGVGGSAVGGGR
ncbi:hypothetical protein CKO38_01545 [Rhodospirillum rubrum]|uniref:hypothetical protein n=1 Tax=Rhodospirillum rubrum TaxID=1085 RepID=UPI001904D063|nr:hypothetical protein [Rhodospirillum rubrum]MBK1663437.1 hypothetical protein [Rhodospirillum rubrum]MBK1675380.1 hypothetical protein [Rhodospirillum rubrum]